MSTAPDVLQVLADRFEPDAFDAPSGRARLRLEVTGEGRWDALAHGGLELVETDTDKRADARISADVAAWRRLGADVRGGMDAFRSGRLAIRDDFHLGIGFLAATSGSTEPERLEVGRVRTKLGDIAVLRAGAGDPVVLIHGLGASKVSFLPTVAALASAFRVLAIDLPGHGDSVKPLGAAYDPRYFAHAVAGFLDACGIDRAHLVGNSMGGRVALEVGFRHPDRTRRIGLLAPSLAWRRDRGWAPLVRVLRPELGLIQPAPRAIVDQLVRRLIPGAHDGWPAVGVDEFLRSYSTPRGRAAFYAALRNIYLDEPEGPEGFWTRLRELQSDSLFVWGRQDTLVPIAFARHVREALPAARHVELDCGHVPQLERPTETHAAIKRFFSAKRAGSARTPAARS